MEKHGCETGSSDVGGRGRGGRTVESGHTVGSLLILGGFGGLVTVALSFHLADALGSRARAEHLGPSIDLLSEVSAADRARDAGASEAETPPRDAEAARSGAQPQHGH